MSTLCKLVGIPVLRTKQLPTLCKLFVKIKLITSKKGVKMGKYDSFDVITDINYLVAVRSRQLSLTPHHLLRGKREVILSVLETLRERYDMTNESRSPSLTQKHDIITGSSLTQKHDIITGSSTLSKEDIITDWARTVVEHTGECPRFEFLLVEIP